MAIMTLRPLGHIDLPDHRSDGGFDHADIHTATDRIYVAHTANDSIDVIDCAKDRYVESFDGFPAVAGALVSESRGLIFTTNRGENTISVFKPGDERNGFKIGVGVKPNGVAFDDRRDLLVVANVGDPALPDSYTASIVDIERRKRVADVKVPGRTRWAIYDAAAQTFFINIASPARIVAIDAAEPNKISKQYEMPAEGPHGLDLDAATGRLFCACDAGVLLALDAASGRILGDVGLSGTPDVIFLNPRNKHLYVAVGDPGVIDVVDVVAMRRKDVVPTEKGAHTLALDRKRNKVYAFLPRSHRAAVFVDEM
jgi:DNA-binding beta-propeller fold protein YncE